MAVVKKALFGLALILATSVAALTLDTGFSLDTQTGVFFRDITNTILAENNEVLVFSADSFGVPYLALDAVFRAGGFRASGGVLTGIDVLTGTVTVDDKSPNNTKWRHNASSRERLAFYAGAGWEFRLLNGALSLWPRAEFAYQVISTSALDGSVENAHGKSDFSGTYWRFSEISLLPRAVLHARWRAHPRFSISVNGFVYPYIWAQTAIRDLFDEDIEYLTWKEGGNWGGGGGAEAAYYPAAHPYLSFFCGAAFEGICLKDGIVETGKLGYNVPDAIRAGGYSANHGGFQAKISLGIRLTPVAGSKE
jgi:hypothetical protein